MPVCVAVCRGKSCAKRPEHDVMLRELRTATGAEVTETRCLGICSGPVVVVADHAGGGTRVFAKIRSRKRIGDLVRVVASGKKPRGKLRKREVGGSERHKALRRLRW